MYLVASGGCHNVIANAENHLRRAREMECTRKCGIHVASPSCHGNLLVIAFKCGCHRGIISEGLARAHAQHAGIKGVRKPKLVEQENSLGAKLLMFSIELGMCFVEGCPCITRIASADEGVFNWS